VSLSEDHKPNRADEKERIEQLGGVAARSEYEADLMRRHGARVATLASCVCCCYSAGPYRVYPGGLAVSRAMGDVGLKQSGLIISTPEMSVVSGAIC